VGEVVTRHRGAGLPVAARRQCRCVAAWALVAAGHYCSALLAAVLGIALHEAAVGRPAVPAR
jgi:hypothetical protein